MGKSGGKSGEKEEVPTYHMSVHFGICVGPIDRLVSVSVNEKEIIKGRHSKPTVFAVNNPQLFGGLKKEGGVIGAVHFLPGSKTQRLSNYLASKLGRTPNNAPSYRNVASLFFTEFPGDLTGGSVFNKIGDLTIKNLAKGFYWRANNASVPGAWAKVTSIPARSWFPQTAEIPHVIYGKINRPMAICLLWDLSTSASTPDFLATKAAINAVLDRVESYVVDNPESRFDVMIQSPGSIFFPAVSVGINRTKVNATKINELRSYVAAAAQRVSNDYANAYDKIRNWFDQSEKEIFARRVIVDITESITLARRDLALPDAEEMLDQAVSPYTDATEVDMYSVLFGYQVGGLGNATFTETLSNQGSATIVNQGDAQGLEDAVLACVAPKYLVPDANGAHMIYAALTNTDYGMSHPPSGLDDASFRAAAQTLYNEAFGLSMIWTQQSSIESFINEILDHIQATLFVHPSTGLLTLKLIRADYNAASLPVLNADNSHVKNFQRKLIGETVNEIVVTWTNPLNEQEETITFQDLANITLQGGVVSDSRNYYGVRSKDLAAALARRDVRSAAAPLATFEIEANRTAWDFTPGGVIKLNYPEYGIINMVLRITNIDYGKPGDPIIKISAMEDIFGLELAEFEKPDDSLWENSDEEPRPADSVYAFTLPYFFSANGVSPTLLNATEYPEVYAGIFVSQEGVDTNTFDLVKETVDLLGNITFGSNASKDIVTEGMTTALILREALSTIPALNFGSLTQGASPEAGGFVLFGEGSEDQNEIGFIQAVGTDIIVKRGVLDTVPREWPINTPVRFFSLSTNVIDQTTRSAFESPNYKILPRTNAGLLEENLSAVYSFTLTERPYLPLRPANVKVNAIGFGVVNCIGLTNIPVTWSNRNRTTEDSTVLAWTDASVGAESLQTTIVEACNDAGVVLTAHTGLTGASFSLPVASFGAELTGIVRVRSSRDGLDSLQHFDIPVILNGVALGYGQMYGLNYGGA